MLRTHTTVTVLISRFARRNRYSCCCVSVDATLLSGP